MIRRTNEQNPDISQEEAVTNSADTTQGNTEQWAKPQVESVSQAEQPNVALSPRLVYVGPNVPGGILQRFQVFKGGFPPHCKDLFEKVPEIKELFVSVEGLEAVRQKIGEPGTNEARLFHIVQRKLSKVVR